MKWADYSGLFRWSQCNHRVLIKGRQEGQRERERERERKWMREAEDEVMNFEGRRRGHEPRNPGGT